ncbi:hypothetical protein [Desulfofundulus thermocisternus]|nr:hypothetical protein [Desulfofundulus thermocisternus]
MSSECCLLKRRSYAFLVSYIPAFAGKARSIARVDGRTDVALNF